MPDRSRHSELLPHLFRQEYAKMTAVLCRHFGLKHIEVAEDIASDVFLKASEHWAIHGVPENPVAWLYTVAKNRTRDYFRHRSVFEERVRAAAVQDGTGTAPEFDYDEQFVKDSQLAMIFAVCNPANAREGQVCLALQILCGFSVAEIASAFLRKTETIKKRLLRARDNLRGDSLRIGDLSESDIRSRQDAVLMTLYLLFNEGYFSRTGSHPIRKELCSEAMRLAFVLTEHPLTNTPQANALLALMCFQSSRLDARTGDEGRVVLFDEQDKALWDRSLIDRGNYYLVNACHGSHASRYHLEAGIAYWHTQEPERKWPHILALYDQLACVEPSPVTALNRLFAVAHVHGHGVALAEAAALGLPESGVHHQLLGYLYTPTDLAKAKTHYHAALQLATSVAEREVLERAMGRLG